MDDLKLQWLTFNVHTFRGWGGWVSEKFQLLSCIVLWLYRPLLVIDKVEEYIQPTKPMNEWLVDDLKKYLTVRGMDNTRKKEVLKQRVLQIMLLPEDERPPVLPPNYGNASDLMETLRAMVLMLTTLLQNLV